MKLVKFLIVIIVFQFTLTNMYAQRQMDNLDRGMVALHCGQDSVHNGWRLLGTEPAGITFNVSRKTGEERALTLTKVPLKGVG